MNPDDPRLLPLAGQTLDAVNVDWERIEKDAADEDERKLISRLRIIHEIVQIHRRDHSIDEDPRDDGAPNPNRPPPESSAGPQPAEPTPPSSHEDPTVTSEAHSRAPGMIGEFRIVRKLGEGGMGIVYEAEQQNPRRPVALKVIRGGCYVDDNRVRMFQREAQTLARFKHPSIGAIYESGRTEDGQHFFAMELVRGETLTEYAKKRGREGPLTSDELEARLALFRKICDAVSYAHQRGVIHRDLKPSNILVLRDAPAAGSGTRSMAVPEIKILDFGLARITDTDVTMRTIVTEVGKVQGTLPYMSPEQVRGNPDEIDLRTDVYSLGVILYELLTGQLPYDLQRSLLSEAVRVICEEPPKSLAKTWSGARRLDGDVQTIVLKALEKMPARRYQSAAALGEDVQRYLADQPILARPPSAAYQLRKLVARHKAPFAFVTALFVLLAGFAVTMTIQAERIARERDRANREAQASKKVSEYLVGLFKVSDPSEARGNSITAREILDKGAANIERDLKDQPLTQARLMQTMGGVYGSLQLRDQAGPLLEKALRIRERVLGPEHLDVAQSLHELAGFHRGDWPREALSLTRRALAIREKALGPEHPDVAFSLLQIASLSDDDAALQTLERAQAIFEKTSPDHKGVAWCLTDRAGRLFARGDYAAARPLFEQALKIKEKQVPVDSADVAIGLNNLGYVLTVLGNYTEAKPLLERAVAIDDKIHDPQYPNTANLHSLGELLRLMHEDARAESLLERCVTFTERYALPNDANLAEMLKSLALVLLDLGQTDRAETALERALAVWGPNDLKAAESLEAYASLLRQTGRGSKAIPLENRARAIRARINITKSGR